MEKIKYKICTKKLDLNQILKDFWTDDKIINSLIKDFVETHNSSLIEKSGTTYIVLDNNDNIVGFFVLNLWTINKNAKNKLFFKQNNLHHEWYPIINLEFLMRKPWKEYIWIWDIIFEFIWEIIKHIEEKIMIKYIYINSIRKRINYFENKGFIVINQKSKNFWTDNVDMLLEI